MKRTDDQRTTKIDSAHADSAANMPHDRSELRRQLLKMILKNEAERRARAVGAQRPKVLKLDRSVETPPDLAVYDPDALLEKEFAADHGPQKRA
jgi:hypothetical protein